MNILVIGGTGFLGKHLVKQLKNNGHTVVLGTRERPDQTNLEVFYCDIDKEEYDSIEKFPRFDILLFLAWSDLSRQNRDGNSHFEFRLKSQRFFDSIKQLMPLQIVVSGSCEEYGLKEGSCSEYDYLVPVTSYGIQKNEFRIFLADHCAQSGVDLLWLRYFYLYGDEMRKDSLFSALREIEQTGALDFRIETSGLQRRDYLHVSEAAKMTVKLIGRARESGIYNIGSGVPKTLREHVEEWKEYKGWQINILYSFDETFENLPLLQYADVRKITQLLNS